MPSLLLFAFIATVWLAVFGNHDASGDIAPYLRSRGENQLSGIEAAAAAVSLARNAVENASPGDHGLFAGPPESISVRYEPLGPVSAWTVHITGPVRSLPNTPEEFTTTDGEIVIELSAFTGELAGNFSAGRGTLSALGISPTGFVKVPVRKAWPS